MCQPFDQAPRRVFRWPPVNTVGPGVTIRLLALAHVLGHAEPRIGDRHHGALVPTPCRQPPGRRTRSGPWVRAAAWAACPNTVRTTR